jgi:hypothetical protein
MEGFVGAAVRLEFVGTSEGCFRLGEESREKGSLFPGKF